MSLEILNTAVTLLTVMIVAATAVAALVQLRHLSTGNQINATLAIGAEIGAKPFVEARLAARQGLEEALADPAFRDYIVAYNRRQPLPPVKPEYLELHQTVLTVGNKFEELGILVKRRIIDPDNFFDLYSWLILGDWRSLEPLNAIARDASGNPRIWENFEFLAVLSEDFLAKHPSSYPAGMRRMPRSNRWPVASAEPQSG